MTKGDDAACYRRNWELSVVAPCRKGRSKFLNFMCMDECPSGMVICDTFSLMCGTKDYCQYFKEEIVADLITAGVTIAVVAGTGGGLGLITLFKDILTLTEKFAHPGCGENAALFQAEREKSKQLFLKKESEEKNKVAAVAKPAKKSGSWWGTSKK